MEKRKNPDTKEYWEWKFQQVELTLTKRNDELAAILCEQKIEIANLHERDQTQTATIAALNAKLKEYKRNYEEALKNCEESENNSVRYKNKCVSLKNKITEVQQESRKELEAEQGKYDKEMTKQKVVNRFKVAQLESQFATQQTKWESKCSALSQNLQEKQELVDKTKQEKEETIAQLTNLADEHQNVMENMNKECLKLIKTAKEMTKQEIKDEISILHSEITKLREQRKDLDNVIKSKNREILKLEQEKQGQAEIIRDRDREIANLLKDRKRLQQELTEEQQKCVTQEAILRSTKETVTQLEDEVSEFKDFREKVRLQQRTVKHENEDLREKLKTLKHDLQITKPTLVREKEKFNALDHKMRDILAGLIACREVLEEPRKLRLKVASLIKHHVEGNAKCVVDRDTENLNVMLMAELKEKNERTERIVEHHKREKARYETAAQDVQMREVKEKVVLVRKLNDQMMKRKKGGRSYARTTE
ncbi:hypothetical protein WMY93_000626 [Mugilogobius chulae]|uniref:Uncharacterized protein n=1 Tax=Mugilogobius chulae TaxID=88201 RepID=A0AAW0Q837_9GOBI